VINVGRLGLEAGVLSKSKIRTGVESGLFTGWDDPRLGTLRALRRRGLQPETIREVMIQVGPKPINVTISWGNIAAINKKIIDYKANRYFFVQDPVKVQVTGLPHELSVKLPLHPDYPDRGYREYQITSENGEFAFYIPAKEVPIESKKLVRLMGLANIVLTQVKGNCIGIFDSRAHSVAREKGAPFIQWVTENNCINSSVTMPDASKALGLAELYTSKLPVDTMIQFERFGFVRVDSQSPLGFFFAHE
jgi:glutamyl-tRNA synthetase